MADGKTAIVTRLAPVYDPSTGEFLGDAHIETAHRSGKRRAKPKGGFVMLQKAALKRLELTGSQWQVFSQLLAHMDHTTAESRVMVGEIAEAIGSTQPSVSRSMKVLQDRHIVVKLGLGRYRVSSHIAYLSGETEDQRSMDPTPEWRQP